MGRKPWIMMNMTSSELLESVKEWKEEIDKLNAETDERIKLLVEERIWNGKKC